VHGSSVKMFAALGNYWRNVSREVDADLRSGGVNISANEFILLHTLSLAHDMTISVSEAVSVLGLPRTTVTGHISRLENLGLVIKGRERKNKKIVTISLSALGEDFLNEWMTLFTNTVSQAMFEYLDYAETYRAMVTYQRNKFNKPASGANAYLLLSD